MESEKWGLDHDTYLHLLPSPHCSHSLPHLPSTHSIPATSLYTMSQTSMSTPKAMPSYSNLWEACIANLCHLPLTQTQRCPAPPMPAVPLTITVSCSPPHPEATLWRALHLPTTSPSEMLSQLTTCPMEKPSNGCTTQQALLRPREKVSRLTTIF